MGARRASPPRGTRPAPKGPGKLALSSWKETLKRVVREFQDDNVMDLAAALTYYAVLSMFPGLLVLLALLGVLGTHPETTDALLGIVSDLGPQSAVDTFQDPIEEVTRNEGGAAALLGVGLIGALWTASGYLGAFIRASNSIYEIEEGRSFWTRRPQQIGMTLLMVMLLALLLISLVVSGPVAEAVGEAIGLESSAVTAWQIAKWPVMILLVAFMISVLYYWAPNVKPVGFHWITPGSALAVVLWIVASVGFALYVSNFGSYSATYGGLGGVIVFLLWIWITNVAILLGQELNAELERQREIEAGVPGAHEEIQQQAREPAD